MGETEFRTLVDVFERSMKLYAGRELFGTKRGTSWEWMTYDAFGREVDEVRGGLAKLGAQRGDKLAIIADNRVEWATIAYACFGLGVALVPMYEAQLDKDWEYIIKDCGAKYVVAANRKILEKTKRFFDTAKDLAAIIFIDGESEPADGDRIHSYRSLRVKDGSPPAIHPEPKDIATLIYTSGTTGVPKGVILSHSNVASNVSAIHEMFRFGTEDRSLSFLPWAHSFGQVVELHGLFSAGASIGLCESVNKILDNLAEVRPTLLFSVPRIFNRIYSSVQKQISEKPAPIQTMVKMGLAASAKKRDGKPVSLLEHAMHALASKLVFEKVRARFGGRLRFAFSGGAAISREVAEFIDGIGITVYEGYGLTETSPIATANSPVLGRKIGSVGKAIPHAWIDIDPTAKDGKKNDLGYEEGEIIAYGPNVMQGYFNRPDDDAAVFIPATDDGRGRGFRTGDMGYKDRDGYVFITGRIKEQYKLENGKYVVPTPMEEELKLSPYILNVMVYGDNKPHNVALIVVNVDAVKAWAERENTPLSATGDELLLDSKVASLIRSEVARCSEKFKGFEAVKDVALISEDFTSDNGMLTPKMSLKRRAVLERYGKQLDALYAKSKS